MEGLPGNYCKIETISKLFGVTVRRVQQLTQEGVIETEKINGKTAYDLIETTRAYIRYLSDKAYGREKKASAEGHDLRKAEADADWKEARAAIANLELSELEGNLHRSEDVEEAFSDFASTVRAAFLSLPGRLAVDTANAVTAMETSALIQEVVNDTLNALAGYQYDPEFYKKKVREREGWRERDEEDEGDQS